jgi:hypothetical protein
MKPGDELSFLDGMDFGTGLDTLQLIPRGIGVTDLAGAPPAAPLGGTGDAIVFQLQRTETYEDYQSAFDFGASATGVFGLFGGNAAFNFSEKRKFHGFSQFLVASVTVTKAFKKIPNPRLDATSDAATLISSGNKDRFRQEFGDMFIIGARMGAAYYAVFEFTCASEEDYTNISASLDAGEFGVFSTSDKFSSSVASLKGHSGLKIVAYQTGGSDEEQETDIDKVITKAAGFAAEVGTTGVPFVAQVQDYASVPLPSPPNFVDIQAKADVLANYATLRNQLVQKMNEIEYIQLHPEQFINPTSFDLKTALAQVTTALNLIKTNASTCVNATSDCKFPDVVIPTITLPSRIASVPTTGVDLKNFEGNWANKDSTATLTMLKILATGPLTAAVSGTTSDKGLITNTASWSSDAKALVVALMTPGAGPVGGKIGIMTGHSLQISSAASTEGPPQLNVIDNIGSLFDSVMTTYTFVKE